MAIFIPRTFPEIFGSMVDTLIATTPLTDVNFGSVFTTMLEAAAQEDDEQYFQMLEIIRNFSLDTTTGVDLENRAFEFGLERLDASNASTIVTLGDTAVTKVSTGVYSGLPGAAAGATSVNGDGSTGFPTSGTIIVGRDTPNSEPIAYTSITVNPNFVVFNLGASLAFDHGTDETIVLSQGGNRLVTAGTVVFVPSSDLSEQIDFTLGADATILDGEEELENVDVTAQVAGFGSNVPIGSISRFDSPPFSTATVRNPQRVTNGRDEESDQELRDRIKDTIQSLSRGTGRSIISSVVGVISGNKRVISASVIEPTIPADVVKLFIDDGTGFVPTFTNVGFEIVVASATGGEKFLSTANVPIVKAFVETQSSEPFTLSGSEILIVDVGGSVETITFASTDFVAPGAATAQEVLEVINANAANYEARISSDGDKVRIFSRSNTLEEITVTGGSANGPLAFPTDTKFTTKLYRKRGNTVELLTKDGRTASIESGNTITYDFSLLTSLVLVIDGKVAQNIFIRPSDFLLPSTVNAEEICATLNAQICGASCSPSSNDTKITILSNLARSLSSKVRILENFDQVWNEEAAVLIDRTTEAQTAGSDVTLFASDLDFLYVGHTTVKFPNINVKLATPASVTINPTFEYWDGAIWKAFGAVDDTVGFTLDGDISFSPPQDWTAVSVSGSAARFWIRIQRNQAVVVTPPIESTIKVCGANVELGFSEVEVVGDDKDYTLNRFIGQIELESPLQALDIVTLGSTETRPRVTTVAQANFGLSGGELLEIVVDGVLQSYTFIAGDFFTPGAALSSEVVIAINREFNGVTATDDVGGRVIVETNTLNGGSIQVNATAANTILQFPIDLAIGFVAHVPALESGLAEPYVFDEDDNVVVIIDGNSANNFTVPCFHEGTLTGVTSPSDFDDSTLLSTFPLAADITGYDYMNLTRRIAVIQDLTYLTTDANPVTVEYVTGTAPLPEITNVTCVADVAGSLNSTYFLIDTPGTDYYVWYSDGGGADPLIGGRTAIPVAHTTGDTAGTIATLTRAAIDALGDFSAVINVSPTVEVTNATAGTCPDAVDGAVPTGFTIINFQQGTDFVISVSVVAEAITVGIQSGVSIATDVKAAVDGFPAAAALVTVTVSGAGGAAQVLVAPVTLVPERRVISTYTPASGKIVLTAPFTFTPVIGDSYQVLPNDADQVARLWSNIAITLLSTEAAILTSSNGTKVQIESLDIGEDASVQVSGGAGNDKLAFSASIKFGVDGYRYFTGLAQLAQKTIDGDPLDEETFPGIRAAGVQVEVAEPVTKPIAIEIDVTPESGITLASLTNNVKSAISAYVNGLNLGDDVIVSAITCAARDGVDGVFDARVIIPSANIAIADNELARVNEENITVG
jgi:uncharacterized phage protein gp47/JayE